MSITLRQLRKSFGSTPILNTVDLDIRTGELLTIVGPSGCGKTTLLRIIAGLEHAEHGEIWLHGHAATQSPPAERRIGFVFQHYALFRHLNVFDNIAFGLRVGPRAARPKLADLRATVMTLLTRMELEHLADAYPEQLSGGQQQRVALARALAVKPKVLLLDEPFGALDARVRKNLRRWLRELHTEQGLTSVLVTHDQEEALDMADRIAVMNHGTIAQIGTPAEVYAAPVSPFVSQFLGDVHAFNGHLERDYVCIGDYRHPHPSTAPHGTPIMVHIRPHDLQLSREPRPALSCGRVTRLHAIGHTLRVELQHGPDQRWIDAILTQDHAQHLALKIGDSVWIWPRQIRVFS